MNLSELDDKAFMGCTALEAINVDTNNTRYASSGGVLYDLDNGKYILLLCPKSKSGTYEIPTAIKGADVCSINDNAFSDCTKLTSVVISDGVMYIYNKAFKNCTAMSSITIPSSVVDIADDAFTGCNLLTIIGSAGSTAESFANSHSISFEPVSSELILLAALSQQSVVIGNSVSVHCGAQDGYPGYQYQVSVKNAGASSFTTVQSYSSNSIVSVTPGTAGTCVIRVSVKDSKGNIKSTDLELTVIGKLVNTSTVSATSAVTGSSVTVTGSATGGTGTKQFAFYYRSPGSSSWVLQQAYSTKTTASIYMGQAGTYTIKIMAKDASEQLAEKQYSVTAYDVLAQNSVISSDKVKLGGSVTVTCSSQGGIGTKQYKTEIRKTDVSTWTVVKDYTTATSVTVTPGSAGKYKVRVTVKDGTNNTVSQSFDLEVYNEQKNTSTISATKAVKGSSVKVSCSSTGGYGDKLYALYVIKPGSTDWTKIQGYGENAEISFKPGSVGTYTVRAKVKDSTGTESRKDFKLEVYSALKNTSEISSTNVLVDKSINVSCSSTGGYGDKLYALYVIKPGSTDWTKIQGYGENAEISFKPHAVGTYTVRAKVKDSTGTERRKDFKLEVYSALKNTSEISSTYVLVDKSINVSCSSTGGYGDKLYALYVIKPGSTDWTKIQGYGENAEISFKPHAVGTYTVRAKVKDSNGTESRKTFKLDVISSLKCTSTISAAEIRYGKSVTVNCSSTGGLGTKQYEVWYKLSTNSAWTKAKDYSTDTTATVTPKNKGTYTIRVKVKDDRNVTAKKDLTLTVTK